MAAAFGVDPGASPEMPTGLSESLATLIPALPSGTSRRMPDPEDLRDLWWRRRGVRIRQPVGGPGQSPSVAARVRRRVRAEPRTAWRCGAIMATASGVAIVRSNGAWTATTTAGLAQGRWMIATGDNDA